MIDSHPLEMLPGGAPSETDDIPGTGMTGVTSMTSRTSMAKTGGNIQSLA